MSSSNSAEIEEPSVTLVLLTADLFIKLPIKVIHSDIHGLAEVLVLHYP